MHGGLLVQVRQSIAYVRYAKPWQQALLSGVLVLGGVALIALGYLIGLAPAALGILFVRATIGNRLCPRRSRRRKQSG
jgi:hypothetical protein